MYFLKLIIQILHFLFSFNIKNWLDASHSENKGNGQQMGPCEIQNFCRAEGISQTKRISTEWEESLCYYIAEDPCLQHLHPKLETGNQTTGKGNEKEGYRGTGGSVPNMQYMLVCKLKKTKTKTWLSLVSNVLALQARRPEYEPQNPQSWAW